MTNRTLPDIELAVVTRLRAAIASDADVGTVLGDTLPAITVEIAGGAPLVEGVLDEPRLSVNAWAADWQTAFELIVRAVDALVTPAVSGAAGWIAGGVLVTRGRTVMRPVRSFDPVAQTARYTATVALAARVVRT